MLNTYSNCTVQALVLTIYILVKHADLKKLKYTVHDLFLAIFILVNRACSDMNYSDLNWTKKYTLHDLVLIVFIHVNRACSDMNVRIFCLSLYCTQIEKSLLSLCLPKAHEASLTTFGKKINPALQFWRCTVCRESERNCLRKYQGCGIRSFRANCSFFVSEIENRSFPRENRSRRSFVKSDRAKSNGSDSLLGIKMEKHWKTVKNMVKTTNFVEWIALCLKGQCHENFFKTET